MRVLYIDDDRINSLLFVETCRLAGGIEVQTAASGVEALQATQDWTPDLLVLDLHLPDTTGYELLGALRRQLDQPKLPAYLCTADDAPLVEVPAREAGFDGCWTKPVELTRVIEELSRRRASLG